MTTDAIQTGSWRTELRQVLLENSAGYRKINSSIRRISYDIARRRKHSSIWWYDFRRPFRVIECKQIFAGQERKVFDNGGDDSLLNMETYTLTSASDTVRHYEYIFTEDFFNNGKPIE